MTYTVTNGEGPGCSFAVAVLPCAPPVCTNATLRLPYGVVDSCAFTNFDASAAGLWSGYGVSLNATPPGVYLSGDSGRRVLLRQPRPRDGVTLRDRALRDAHSCRPSPQPPADVTFEHRAPQAITTRSGRQTPTAAACSQSPCCPAARWSARTRQSRCRSRGPPTAYQRPSTRGSCTTAGRRAPPATPRGRWPQVRAPASARLPVGGRVRGAQRASAPTRALNARRRPPAMSPKHCIMCPHPALAPRQLRFHDPGLPEPVQIIRHDPALRGPQLLQRHRPAAAAQRHLRRRGHTKLAARDGAEHNRHPAAARILRAR